MEHAAIPPNRQRGRRGWRLLAMAAGVTLAGSTLTAGGALVTTKSVVVDNSLDSSPYDITYGIFNAELRPHLGETFSEGTKGFLAFNVFEGPTPPEPLPITGVRQSLVLTVELPKDLELDRSPHERASTPNWCFQTPQEIERIISAGSCRVVQYRDGSSVVQLKMDARQDITVEHIKLLNDIRIGIGVVGRPGIVDGAGTVFAGLSLRNYAAPTQPGLVGPARTRLAVIDYSTSANGRSDLGVWDMDLVNENPRPGDRIFQNGDTGRLTFQLAPPGKAVRMKTGEYFAFTVSPPWRNEDNYLEPLDWPDFCLDPGLHPGFDITCVRNEPPGNGTMIEVRRTGPDIDDAFPGGFPVTMRLQARLPASDSASHIPNIVELYAQMEQSGSHRPIQTGSVDFWPRRTMPLALTVADLSVSGADGSELYVEEDGVVSFSLEPDLEDREELAALTAEVDQRIEVGIELPADVLDVAHTEDDIIDGVDACDFIEWDESTGLIIESCTMTSDSAVTRISVVFVASGVSPEAWEQEFSMRVRAAAPTAEEERFIAVEVEPESGDEVGSSRVSIPIRLVENHSDAAGEEEVD